MIDFNYFKLGFTIFISVLFAGLLLFFIQQYYYSSVIDRFMSILPKTLLSKQHSALSNLQVPTINFPDLQKQKVDQVFRLQESNRKQQKRFRNESAARRAIQQTNDETCSFWRESYRKSKTDYNKVNLDSACSRAAND